MHNNKPWISQSLQCISTQTFPMEKKESNFEDQWAPPTFEEVEVQMLQFEHESNLQRAISSPFLGRSKTLSPTKNHAATNGSGHLSPYVPGSPVLSRANSKSKFGNSLRTSKNDLSSKSSAKNDIGSVRIGIQPVDSQTPKSARPSEYNTKTSGSKNDLSMLSPEKSKLSNSRGDLTATKFGGSRDLTPVQTRASKPEPSSSKLEKAQSSSMMTLREPMKRTRKTYWSPLKDWDCWRAMLYFLVINLAWGGFCFVWVLTTGLVSIGLLPLFLVGYPLLYASAISWRALAHIQCRLLFTNDETDFDVFPIYVNQKEDSTPLRTHILDPKTWVVFAYFSFIKIFSAVWSFCVAFTALLMVIVAFPVAPPLFCHMKFLWDKERKLTRTWFSI